MVRLHVTGPRFASVLFALGLAATPRAGFAAPLWLDRPDLHAHFWLSYGVSLTLTEVLEGPDPRWGPQLGTGPALALSTGVVGALGLFKELVVDDTVGTDDLAADVAGLLANVVLQVFVPF